MTDSYYKTLLIEGKAKKLQELGGLASKERPPAKAKQYAEEAATILRDLAELDDKPSSALDGPAGLDYRDDVKINAPIIRFLTEINRPASEPEIIKELIRGQFRGYKDVRKMAIRVGRCVRSYDVGKAKENPKLKVKRGLVGLPEWPDKMFS